MKRCEMGITKMKSVIALKLESILKDEDVEAANKAAMRADAANQGQERSEPGNDEVDSFFGGNSEAAAATSQRPRTPGVDSVHTFVNGSYSQDFEAILPGASASASVEVTNVGWKPEKKAKVV